MRVIIAPDRVQQPAPGNETSFGNTTLPDNHLPGVCRHLIRVSIEVANHTVHLNRLIDIPGNNSVIVPFLG